jgi:DNA-binding transcriptional regulator LsrR (DeoR family)
MKRTVDSPPEATGRRENSVLAYRVAAMHFQDRMSNLDIAGALGISRFRVARLLDQAIDSGVVDIRIDLPSDVDEDLSTRVRALGLTDARVLDDGSSPDHPWSGLSALALRHVSGLLSDGDRLAIAWGPTLDAIVGAAAHLRLRMPKLDVVQLVGGVPSPSGGLESSDLVRRFSSLTGGRSIVLNAPLVVPTAEVSAGIRREGSVAATLAAASSADAALFSVGSWDRGSSRLRQLLDERDRASAAAQDVVADVCGVMISSAGRLITGGLAERIVGIDADSLTRIPRRVAVVLGPEKTDALRAALRTGLITDLILDATAARALLHAASG